MNKKNEGNPQAKVGRAAALIPCITGMGFFYQKADRKKQALKLILKVLYAADYSKYVYVKPKCEQNLQ